MQAKAPEAFEHIFDSAGARAFVNEYAESAVAPALYNAVAERTPACPVAPLYHTLGDDTCRHNTPKHLPPLLALTGRMPHTISADKPPGLRAGSFSCSTHRPEAIDPWGQSLRTRLHGQPVAVCLARNKGPIVSALRQ